MLRGVGDRSLTVAALLLGTGFAPAMRNAWILGKA